MKLFKCQACGQLLYFENMRCERCAHRLGYLAAENALSALELAGGENWTALAAPGRAYRFCDNAASQVCNWLVPADHPERFCAACRHNGIIPDLSDVRNLFAWRKLEEAKHRLFYTLIRLDLPRPNRIDDPTHGLVFNFLADLPDSTGSKVMTGHDDGVVTIALAEADDAEREKRRSAMGEPYRTLLGHFRHEVGHFYWDVLVRDGGLLDECRAVFGDDSQDYEEALKTHYKTGAPADWRENFVSMYATTHPWEDFAETWAHYLHILDTLEMARSFGIRVKPSIDERGELRSEIDFDPYEAGTIREMVDCWVPMIFAMNSLNRTMGQQDLYPFVLSPAVIDKLGFIHDLVHGRVRQKKQAAAA